MTNRLGKAPCDGAKLLDGLLKEGRGNQIGNNRTSYLFFWNLIRLKVISNRPCFLTQSLKNEAF